MDTALTVSGIIGPFGSHMNSEQTGSKEENGAEKRVFIRTFGCQMNEYDSGKMRAKLSKDGFAPTDDPTEADLILLNTCS